MHDEGTGGNAAGGYGIFPLFPLTGCAFASCPVGIAARATLRAAGKDGQSSQRVNFLSSLNHVI